MAITVFFLICGPFAALLYVPLATRKQVRIARNAAESRMASAREFQPLRWSAIPCSLEAPDHTRDRKSAA
jgi:hypothetical protein